MGPLLVCSQCGDRVAKKYFRKAAFRFESCYRLRCLNRITRLSQSQIHNAPAAWPSLSGVRVKAAPRLRVDRSPTNPGWHRSFARLAIAAVVALSLAHLSAQIVPGTNVNMVAGTSWPDGDPYLQRQNEPSVAVSTRNVLHLFAGANDYRTVDLPGLPADKPTGDAWLGIFKSFDGGRTWKSNLLPGYPQDASAIGNASPLKGFDAAADPLVRAGANGLFVYSGIAFQRAAIVGSTAVQAGLGDTAEGRNRTDGRAGESKDALKQRERAKENEKGREKADKERKLKGESKHARAEQRARDQERAREFARERAAEDPGQRIARRKQGREQPLAKLRGGAEEDDEEAGVESGTASAVFVSTFTDLDNRENGDPVSYIRTTLVDHDSGSRFLDKQWTAVDIPRANGQLCVFDGCKKTVHLSVKASRAVESTWSIPRSPAAAPRSGARFSSATPPTAA
jgi:hypothetical protein